MMKKRQRIIIKGNVQRVGFRHQAGELANELGITGKAVYINHDILIEAEGNEQELNQFLDWCRKGPEGCCIESIELTELPLLNQEVFEIVHGVLFSKELQAAEA